MLVAVGVDYEEIGRVLEICLSAVKIRPLMPQP
jgi:hypothetical protein